MTVPKIPTTFIRFVIPDHSNERKLRTVINDEQIVTVPDSPPRKKYSEREKNSGNRFIISQALTLLWCKRFYVEARLSRTESF